MKPILVWQYNSLIKELLLLQQHSQDPSCPCESEGEMCARKHLLTIEALAEETATIEEDEKMAALLNKLALEAKEHRKLEEQKLCGAEIEPEDLASWARRWRKEFEQLSLACDLPPPAPALVEELAKTFQPFYPEFKPEPTLVRVGPGLKGIIPQELSFTKVQTKLIRSRSYDPTKAPVIKHASDLQPYFRLMRNADQEWLLAIYADHKGHVIGADEISIGERFGTTLSLDTIYRSAILLNASKIFLAHNHPSGSPEPSEDDIKIFENLRDHCPLLNITVEDFIVVGANEDYSIRGNLKLPAPPTKLEEVAKMFEKTGCPCKTGIEPEKMSVQAIQDELNALLFDEETWKACDAKDRELLTIVIARPKAHYFDFLLGKTEWKVRGKWRRPEDDFDIEENVQLDIEFKDASDECVGKRVIALLKAYNAKAVGEMLLYARTIPIEEGTLGKSEVGELQQITLPTIGGAVLIGVGLRAGGKVVDWVAQKFKKAKKKDDDKEGPIDEEGGNEGENQGEEAGPDDSILAVVTRLFEKGGAGEVLVAQGLGLERVSQLGKTECERFAREGYLPRGETWVSAAAHCKALLGEANLGAGYARLPKANLERIERELHQAIRIHASETDHAMLGWYEGKINSLMDVVWWFGREDDTRPYVEWATPYQSYLQAAEGITEAAKKKHLIPKQLKEAEMANTERFCLSGDAWFELQNIISRGEKQKAMELMWSKGEKLILAPMTDESMLEAEWEVAPYARQLPAYVDVFHTTIAKHYRPSEDFHEGSIRVVKPEPDILVYLGCLKGDEWDAEAERCSPNPTVVKTIVPNTSKYLDELEHLKLVHPEVKVNYRTKEVGVEPVVSEEEQKELEAVGKALDKAEVV